MKPFLKTSPVLFMLIMAHVWTRAQSPETLRLRNTTFEAYNKYFVIPPGWTPQRLFLGQKQVKELRLTRFYREEEKSQQGNTHIALATYVNGTRENIGQRLRYPMIQGHTYAIDIWLAWSPFRSTVHPIQQLPAAEKNLRPVKVQIFGFASKEDMTNALLAESPVVDHPDWRKYTLEWESPGKYEYLYLVATWVGDSYYNGNILLDNISDIRVSMTSGKE